MPPLPKTTRNERRFIVANKMRPRIHVTHDNFAWLALIRRPRRKLTYASKKLALLLCAAKGFQWRPRFVSQVACLMCSKTGRSAYRAQCVNGPCWWVVSATSSHQSLPTIVGPPILPAFPGRVFFEYCILSSCIV